MNDTNTKVEEIDKKISLANLMMEKRRGRIVYYEKLLKMGLAADDTIKLQFSIGVKESEIKTIEKEIDWLYMQKAFYAL